MDVLAIIPVKSFVSAKSRLRMDDEARTRVCEAMLSEILCALESSEVSQTAVVTREDAAARIAAEHGADVIRDPHESGVNDAVALADDTARKYDASVVLPQDIPLVTSHDIDAILHMTPKRGTLVVPSRHLDGTNAYVRSPPQICATRYDEGTYRVHMDETATLAFVRRIMIDVDTRADLDYVIAQRDKPDLSDMLRSNCCR